MSEFEPKDQIEETLPRSKGRGSRSSIEDDVSSDRAVPRGIGAGYSTAVGGGSGDASQSGDLTLAEVVNKLRALFAIVRSRWITGLAGATIVVGVFGYFFLRTDPDHTAVSTLLAQSPLDELLRSNIGVRSNQKDSQENLLQNHLSVMKSRRFSVALASEFSAEEKAKIVQHFMEPGQEASEASFVNMLAMRSGAERQRDREFFTLSFRHPNTDVAIMVANRMTATYLKLVQQEIKETNLAAAEMLRIQAEHLQTEISQLEEKQREFREKHNIVSLEESQGLMAERLQRIDKSRSESRIRRFQLESKLKDAKRDMARDELPFENLYLANFANNQQLRQGLDALVAERKVLALRYGRKHPKMLEIDGQISGVRENLKRNFDLAYRDLENQYQNLVAVEQQLDREFKEEFVEGIEIGHLANQFLVIGSEVDAKREALRDLLRRVSNAVVVSNLPAHVMRVVDPAYIAKPRLATKKVASVFALLLAGGAFFGVPLNLHLFDQRIKPATDIEKELGKILLGGVSRMPRSNKKDRPHIVRNNLDLSKVEPFMAIIAQIELISVQDGGKLFFVTSATSSEGKSTISSNLADGFTLMGRKTLLIDGDLRRPCLHQFNRVRKNGGLLRWAEAEFSMEDFMSEDSPLGITKLVSGTYLLPAGGIYPQPAQFLVSSHFDELFEKLKEQFDIIIVDTPPVGLYPDALALAQSAGETILVAREATARVAQICRTIGDIDNTASPILGVILNGYSSGGFNARLTYGSTYDSYRYMKKKRNKENSAAAAKSLVGQLMNEDTVGASSRPQFGKTKSGAKKGKSALGAKSLVGQLMAAEKLNSKTVGKKGRANPNTKSLIGKLMSDDK